jgi:hypothetical protein
MRSAAVPVRETGRQVDVAGILVHFASERLEAQNIWLLDPLERVAYTYTASGVQLVRESRLAVPGSPVYLDLAQVFTALD